MIKKIEIENYKSIDKLDLEIGQFNVFIGQNGCGKTNILEAIAFASGIEDLDNGNLSLKGIRITDPIFYRNGFFQKTLNESIEITLTDENDNKIWYSFNNTNEPYSKWEAEIAINGRKMNQNEPLNVMDDRDDKRKQLESKNIGIDEYIIYLEGLIEKSNAMVGALSIPIFIAENFVVYAPENYFLRNYNIESPYTQPLGTKGEGLLKLIKVIKQEKPEQYEEILKYLHLIDWFSGIDIDEDSLSGTEFKISDTYLEEGIGGFDIRNANEGFFLLLFYITLFVSDYTPLFFAIDNIDSALNPKLCTKLIEILAGLAKKHNKQVLITTHNPAILDGINLNDPEQRLLVVSRNNDGYTRVRRIEKKPPLQGEKPMKLSEQFLRGYIGGLPKNF